MTKPADEPSEVHGQAAGTDIQLDCRGQRCPLPVVALARTISTLDIGTVVRVIADDPAAALDIAAWCRMRDQEFVGSSTVDSVPVYKVRRVS